MLSCTRRQQGAMGEWVRLGWVLAMACAFPAHATTDLTGLSLEQLMNIEVVGASKYAQKQTQVAAAVSVITRDEIRTFGWRSLGEALSSLPGVHITYDRQYSYLGARGFGLPGDFNTRVLVTINGNRINDSVYDGGPTGREFPLDMSLVERIEFIPGPGGAVFGQNSMLGVVNVVTRTGADVGGVELTAAWQVPQRAGAASATWGRQLENGTDVLLSVSGFQSKGEDLFLNFGSSGTSGIAQGMDGEDTGKFFARAAQGPLSVEVVHSNSRKDDPAGSYLSDPLVAGQYITDRFTVAQVQYKDNLGSDALQVQGRLFVGEYRFFSHLSYGTFLDSPAASDWHGAEIRLLSTRWEKHRLMVGVELQNSTRIEQQTLDLANPGNNVSISSTGYRYGMYAQDEWQLSDTVSATLGLRVDKNSVADTQTSPRAALIWQPDSATTFKALYGRAYRAPNAFERDYGDGVTQVANTSLRGETIDTRELVVDRRVGDSLNLRGSVYQWDMQDLIVLGVDSVSGLSQYQTGGSVRAQGLELSADKVWPGGSRLRGSLSLQKAGYASGTSLANSPTRLGKLNFSAPLPYAGLRLGYELQYDSARLALNGTELESYAVSNLHLTTERWIKGVELGVSLRNLFDRRYAHPLADTNWQTAMDQDGRSVQVHARYRF